MPHVRVRCRRPPPPPRAAADLPEARGRAYPGLNGVLPDWSDVAITVVREDGAEEPLTGVCWLRYEARAGAEPPRLTMQFCDAELDVEADVEPTMLVPPRA